MLFNSLSLLTVVGAAAVGGNAFLIPPELNTDLDVGSLSEFDMTVLDLGAITLPDPQHQVVKVGCKGCLKDGGDGALIFDLTVSPLDQTKFLINGAEVTPFDFNIMSIPTENPFPATLRLPLVGVNEELKDLALEDLRSRTVSVEYNLVSAIWGSDVGELAKMVVDANKVDGRWVEGGKMEVVKIVLLREEKGGKIEIVGVDVGNLGEMGMGMMEDDEGASCHGMFCSLDALVEKVREWSKVAGEKVNGWGKKVGHKWGCGGRKGGMKDGHHHDGGDNRSVPSIPSTPGTETETTTARPWSRPHHHHHHHDKKPFHHGGAYRIMDDDNSFTLYKIFRQVLMPIAIGVCAGMVVSLMGMVVGHFAVLAFNLAYAKLTGRPRGHCRYRRQTEIREDDEEEGKGLLVQEEEDAPPKYEDEVVQAVVVDCDEKQ